MSDRLSEISAVALPRWCVFTTDTIAGRLLDHVGWRADRDLAGCRLLEPSAGAGNIAVPAARRLIASLRRVGASLDHDTLSDRLLCVEIRAEFIEALRTRLASELIGAGVARQTAELIVERWVEHGDFLKTRLDPNFTHVVGNPPYGRQRGKRANVAIDFMDIGFRLLTQGGQMAMLCPVTLASATGGGQFRDLVSSEGRVACIVPLPNDDVYETEVAVPPAIYVLEKSGCESNPTPSSWLVGDEALATVVRACEQHMPTLEDAGIEVRLGFATGANAVFVCDNDAVTVERQRLIPCAAIGDLPGPAARWRGRSVIDVFDDVGKVVAAGRFPKLDAYLERQRSALEARRHPSTKRDWRRTIQRPDRGLASTEKVLVGETGRRIHVSSDHGGLLPLNSVHAAMSPTWPTNALTSALAVAAGLWAEALGCRRPGGDLRLNAGNLKRVRLPRWADVETRIADRLLSEHAATRLAAAGELYGLDWQQIEKVAAYGWLRSSG